MLTHIFFQYGDSFVLYSKGLTVIILNIYGLIIKDNLRDILIFDYDFNFANKIYFGSSLVKI